MGDAAQKAAPQLAAKRSTSIVLTRSKSTDQHCLVTTLSTRCAVDQPYCVQEFAVIGDQAAVLAGLGEYVQLMDCSRGPCMSWELPQLGQARCSKHAVVWGYREYPCMLSAIADIPVCSAIAVIPVAFC